MLRNFLSGQPRSNDPAGKRIADFLREIILKGGSLRDLASEKRRGTLTYEQAGIRKAQIDASILEFIDELDRILAKTLEPQPTITRPVSLTPPLESPLEKVWSGTLQSVSWLAKGVTASRSVCRVVSPAGIGTGFIVGPGIVLTNNHVVPSIEAAAKTTVEFNFEEDANGRLMAHNTYNVDTKSAFVTSPVELLDCTILKISEAEGEPPLASWGMLPLGYSEGDKVSVGAHVTIVQHPQGGPKKIAATANEVVNIYDRRLQYMTDTMGGSSGSPVFNDSWKVIAIHHAGGNIIKNDRQERFFANEGILFSYIMRDSAFRQILSP